MKKIDFEKHTEERDAFLFASLAFIAIFLIKEREASTLGLKGSREAVLSQFLVSKALNELFDASSAYADKLGITPPEIITLLIDKLGADFHTNKLSDQYKDIAESMSSLKKSKVFDFLSKSDPNKIKN